MIKVEGLTKQYARNVAVDNISFEVEKGQIVGFIGPNGAGKTTTMRILTGFMPPTAGRVEVAGYNVLEEPIEVKKRIGYLPETPPLYPEMRVDAYLAFAGALKGIESADIENRVAEACERFELTHVRKKVIRTLSKGFRQRVGLAQAIINNPEVLVLDEPTSGLDPKQIIDTRSLIRNLAGDHTVILSTHILQAVERICDEVIVIHQGKLAAKDTVSSLRKRLLGMEALEIDASGSGDPEQLCQQLEAIAGVTRASIKERQDGRCVFELDSDKDRSPNGALARTVIDSGWNLLELRVQRAALEDIYLHLTVTDEPEEEPVEEPPAEAEPEAGGEE